MIKEELEEEDLTEILHIPKKAKSQRKYQQPIKDLIVKKMIIKKMVKKTLHVQIMVSNQKQNLKNKIDQNQDQVKTEEDEINSNQFN